MLLKILGSLKELDIKEISQDVNKRCIYNVYFPLPSKSPILHINKSLTFGVEWSFYGAKQNYACILMVLHYIPMPRTESPLSIYTTKGFFRHDNRHGDIYLGLPSEFYPGVKNGIINYFNRVEFSGHYLAFDVLYARHATISSSSYAFEKATMYALDIMINRALDTGVAVLKQIPAVEDMHLF
ncbi:MAG: hypothetical protein M0031_00820 [Thermaerobacter sp.]|jgi:hypothetical protein|nr:hypothetical protein [Thermaerobacter sp.]